SKLTPCSRTEAGSRAKAVEPPGRELMTGGATSVPPKRGLLTVSIGDQRPAEPLAPLGVPFLTTENTPRTDEDGAPPGPARRRLRTRPQGLPRLQGVSHPAP